MPFKRMLSLTMAVVCEVGLFSSPILALNARGWWTGSSDVGVKLLAACYFELHRKVFHTALCSAADLFAQSDNDVKRFVANVRETIWRAHGAQGKKNCPAWDALEFYVKRGHAVLEYWQATFDGRMQIPDFRGREWRSLSGNPEQELTSENVVVQLSEYALLGAGVRVKLMTCGCKSDNNPKCNRCTCGNAGRSCVPGYCGCKLKCVGHVDGINAAPANGGGGVGGDTDTWMLDLSDTESIESDEDDAAADSDLGDSLEEMENDAS